jgi:hypothetical protein
VQEKSAVRGGILADEMGMGKTIQAIGLILANRPDPGNSVQQRLRLQTEQDHRDLMCRAPPVRRRRRRRRRRHTLPLLSHLHTFHVRVVGFILS